MYSLLKIWVRLGLKFYCKKIIVNFQKHPSRPTILACNHPNSFLDALIIGSHYDRTIYFLARGDVFSKPWVSRILRGMNMIPVYRITEGREQLKNNLRSFDLCLDVLEEKGTILIFSEGICKNEWTLRPLKKGTARLAHMAFYEKEINDLVVLPTSLSYSSFTALPLTVIIKEGESITQKNVTATEPSLFYQEFNSLLQKRLNNNLLSQNRLGEAEISSNSLKRTLLSIPAFIGWVLHKPLYNYCKNLAADKTAGTVFYHSVLFGMLLISYPVILLIFTAVVVLLTGQFYLWLLLFVLPFTAWCYKEYKS